MVYGSLAARLASWPARNWLLLWLAAAIAVLAFFTGVSVPTYARLASDGVPTSGVLVRIEAQNHNLHVVRYEVAGVSYERGSTFVAAPNPQDVAVGDRVQVVYLPLNPTVMTIGDPRELIANDVAAGVIAGLVLPTFAVGINYWRVRSLSKSSTHRPA